MNSNYLRSHNTYNSSIPGLHYHIYKNSNPQQNAKLLLLHGSRLGGIETWDAVVHKLQGWSEILVPDLPGAGILNPINKTDHDFDLEILLKVIIDLVNLHGWNVFDIASYSFGGFLSMVLTQRFAARVARQFIIESALLPDVAENLPEVGTRLNAIAELMQHDPNRGNQLFSELMSNQQSRRFSLMSNIRPIHNPLGFANLLKILTKVYCSKDVWPIINAQKAVTTLLAEPATAGKINMLACIQQQHPWQVVAVKNADHGLIFTNPQLVAEKMNEWYLSSSLPA